MSLVVLGVNHKTAKLQLRERWSYQPNEVVTTLETLSKKLDTDEIALLSTCNRTEVYCDINNPEQVINWFNQEIKPITCIDIETHGYFYQDEEAVTHIMRVASGLDSLVVGEPQILGQFKQAYSLAKKANKVGKKFDKLFNQAFCVAKSIRNNTEIGLNSMSVASVSIDLIASEFKQENFDELEILLIGSGDTIKTVGRNLVKRNINQISIANRNRLHANDLAEDLFSYAKLKNNNNIDVKIFDLGLLKQPEVLAKFDVIFTATSSPVPLVHKNVIQSSLDICNGVKPKGKLVLIDLAVPRDIEPECTELKQVCLYTVDDLETILNNNNAQRKEAAFRAEKIVLKYAQDFCSWETSLTLLASLCSYREQAELMCQDVIAKAQKRLDAGHDTKEVLVSSLQLLRNKLLHHPTVTLKALSKSNDTDLEQIKDLLNI